MGSFQVGRLFTYENKADTVGTTSFCSSLNAIVAQEKLDETQLPEYVPRKLINNRIGALGGSISRRLPVLRTSRRSILLEWSLRPVKGVMRLTRIMWIRYVLEQ